MLTILPSDSSVAIGIPSSTPVLYTASARTYRTGYMHNRNKIKENMYFLILTQLYRITLNTCFGMLSSPCIITLHVSCNQYPTNQVFFPQQCLNFFPLPHGQGAFLPTFFPPRTYVSTLGKGTILSS